MKNDHVCHNGWLKMTVNCSNHNIIHYCGKRFSENKCVYLNHSKSKTNDSWAICTHTSGSCMNNQHLASAQGQTNTPGGLNWPNCWVSKEFDSWQKRGFDCDVVKGIQIKTHKPLIPGRSMLACSWIPIPLRIIRREPSLNAPEHVTSWDKKTKRLFPPLS